MVEKADVTPARQPAASDEPIAARSKQPAKASPTEKQPAAKSRADSGSIDFDVSEWLSEADAVDRERRKAEPETRQFQLDETDRLQLEQAEAEQAAEAGKGPSGRPAKKPVGKLPQKPGQAAANSREAAANMLKKFFNNR
jgi:hypothetical protein